MYHINVIFFVVFTKKFCHLAYMSVVSVGPLWGAPYRRNQYSSIETYMPYLTL